MNSTVLPKTKTFFYNFDPVLFLESLKQHVSNKIPAKKFNFLRSGTLKTVYCQQILPPLNNLIFTYAVKIIKSVSKTVKDASHFDISYSITK